MRCFCGREIINPRDEVCHECMACIADSIQELEDEDAAFDSIYDSYVNPDREHQVEKKSNVITLPRAYGTSGSAATTAQDVITIPNTPKKDKNKKDEEPITWEFEE